MIVCLCLSSGLLSSLLPLLCKNFRQPSSSNEGSYQEKQTVVVYLFCGIHTHILWNRERKLRNLQNKLKLECPLIGCNLLVLVSSQVPFFTWYFFLCQRRLLNSFTHSGRRKVRSLSEPTWLNRRQTVLCNFMLWYFFMCCWLTEFFFLTTQKNCLPWD